MTPATEEMNDAGSFFAKIVKPNVDDYRNKPSEFRTAFNAATALFHFHEWLFEYKQAELEAKYSLRFSGKGDFWGYVGGLVPSSKFIRDLANASKHVKLTVRPSTSMTHIANMVIQCQYGHPVDRLQPRGLRSGAVWRP